MKRRCLSLVRLVAAVAVAVLMGACDGRELCYDHSHVSPVMVEFDWSLAPDAEPMSMVVWFFSVDTDASYRFELTGGGDRGSRGTFDSRIQVRPGTYRVLCHNGSTDNNIEQGRYFDEYRLVTLTDDVLAPMNRNDNAPLPPSVASQPVRMQASATYAHALEGTVTVEPSATAEKHIRFTPVTVTAVYDVLITGVVNLRADTEASAVITGLAEGWHVSEARPDGIQVTVPFGLNHCGSDCLRGRLLVFGDNAQCDVRHYLRVYTSYKLYYDYDVTDQIHNAADSKHIEIKVDGLKLPASGDGMSPGISDWDDAEDVEIQM